MQKYKKFSVNEKNLMLFAIKILLFSAKVSICEYLTPIRYEVDLEILEKIEKFHFLWEDDKYF